MSADASGFPRLCFQVVARHEDLLAQATGIESLEGDAEPLLFLDRERWVHPMAELL